MTSLICPELDIPAWVGRALASDLGAPDAIVLGIVVHRDDDTHLVQSVASLLGQSRPLDGVVVAHIGAGEAPAWICDRFPNVRLLAASGPASTAAVVEAIVAALPADGYLFQEATDWSAPTRLEQMLRTAAAEHASLVGSDHVLVEPDVPDAHTRTMPADGNAAFAHGTGSVIEPCTMLVERTLIERLGGFSVDLSIAAGDEFVARAAVVSRVVNVSRVLYFRRPYEASDWSSSSSRPSLSERVVFAALGERSRLHAVSMARRQTPDVVLERRRRAPSLLHLGGPPVAPVGVVERNRLQRATGLQVWQPPAPARVEQPAREQRPPVFVVSPSESLSRFIACALGQHPGLVTVEVTSWMLQVAQLSARFLMDERERAAVGATSPPTPEAVYRAASASVDTLFVEGPSGARSDRGHPAHWPRRWVGAVRAEGPTLAAAALLYPEAVFLHVVRPVDDTIAAELRVQDDSDVEDLYHAWLSGTHAILDIGQMVGPDRLRTAVYAELLEQPDATMRRWLEVLGEEPETACAEFVSQGSGRSPQGWSGTRIADLTSVPVQTEARRLSLALDGSSSTVSNSVRTDVLAKMLTKGSTETNRRRRAGDVHEDDRNPYVASHDLVRRSAPKDAIVCVVSKGDEMAVRIRGHALGWHFPQTADGSYVGYHPKDAREAIAHLETLRDRGASLFLIPDVYLWWLTHYAELRLHLERSYLRLPSAEGEGGLWDLRSVEARSASPWGLRS